MIDHVRLHVTNYDAAKEFYTKALKPLGYSMLMEFGTSGGFGTNAKPDLWLTKSDTIVPTHVAIVSPDRKSVDAFYDAALAAGGKDNGKPGLRTDYHPNYYSAFVHDLEGNNIEAVTHKPE